MPKVKASLTPGELFILTRDGELCMAEGPGYWFIPIVHEHAMKAFMIDETIPDDAELSPVSAAHMVTVLHNLEKIGLVTVLYLNHSHAPLDAHTLRRLRRMYSGYEAEQNGNGDGAHAV